VTITLLPTAYTIGTPNNAFVFNIDGIVVNAPNPNVYAYKGGNDFNSGFLEPFPSGLYALTWSFPVLIIKRTVGSAYFVGSPYSVQRPGGTTTVTLQVVRADNVGGFKGAVQVSYHTTDGTAIAGVAYTTKTGTISWADGVGGAQSITITILNGGAGTQSFTVTIDNPTNGLTIIVTPTATVNITAGAPPANPTSSGAIPNQVADLEAFADPNGHVQAVPNPVLVQDSLSYYNRNFLINSYATTGIRPDLNAVFFISTTVGWFVGDGGMIFKTTDAGVTWVQQTSTVVVELEDIFFSDSTHGWAVGADGTILVTTNGGTTWAAQTSGVATRLNAVGFISNTNGWAVGDGGVIRVTTNGGGTWSLQTSGVATDLNDVYFVDGTHGWAVGDGGVILFYNGTTWAAQTSGTAVNLNGVTFTSSTSGWAVGDDGVILFWNGTTWAAQTSGVSTQIDLREVDFASATVGWAVGTNGTILATTNGGSTWTPQTSGTTNDLNGLAAASTSIAWAVGDNGTILTTANGGTTWTPQSAPLPIGASGGNGGSFGGGDDYANYDQGFSQTGFLKFQGAIY
jgi:photosystem II stability/assembly factor-like uncharacterized protein